MNVKSKVTNTQCEHKNQVPSKVNGPCVPWCLYQMVTQITVFTCEISNFRFPTTLDISKCLKQIKLPNTLVRNFFELPSYINTMMRTVLRRAYF